MQQNCTPQELWNAPLCTVLKQINDLRSGSLSNSSSVGDLYESLRQAINLPPGTNLPGVDVVGMLLSDVTVKKVTDAILQAYYKDPSQTQHYFIVVAHSQGNFFAEAIAKYMKNYFQEIFAKHLGIVALASPTNYASLQDPEFVRTKIVHHTRADDAINAVATIGALAANVGVPGKRPFTSNDPPLWPWPTSGGWDRTFGLTPSYNSKPRPDLFGTDQLVLSCDPGMGPFGCVIGRFFSRLGYQSGVKQNPELYAPLLNSHLLENYLDKPAATMAMKALNYKPALVPWLLSPRPPPCWTASAAT